MSSHFSGYASSLAYDKPTINIFEEGRGKEKVL
jgi:hypothetical protein